MTSTKKTTRSLSAEDEEVRRIRGILGRLYGRVNWNLIALKDAMAAAKAARKKK